MPLGSVVTEAVKTTVWSVVTLFEVAMNVRDCTPAGITTVAGTLRTFGLLLVRFTVTPRVGANSLRVSVPVTFADPPTTLFGLTVKLRLIGRIVKVVLTVWVPPKASVFVAEISEV